MALTPKLDLRQSQNLVMTPQLRQAIKILQLSNLELSEFVLQEIEQNPFLERDTGDAINSDNDYSSSDEDVSVFDKASEQESLFDNSGDDAPPDADYENTFDDCISDAAYDDSYDFSVSSWDSKGGSSSEGFADVTAITEKTVSGDKSLHQIIEDQVSLVITSPADKIIAKYLTEGLDECGYMRADMAEIATKLNCPTERVEKVLKMMQGFEPSGLFATSLKECIEIQLKDKNRYDPAIAKLLDNLDMLAKRDLVGLCKICECDSEDLAEMLDDIKSTDPKPALQYEFSPPKYIVPDVILTKKADGHWRVELNSDTLPKVLINNKYFSEIKGNVKSKDDKSYISEKMSTANWLVKALHQRATTILKVAEEIAIHQRNFFNMGIEFLKPMVLREIASAIGMHESTVSRVTTNKYILSPRGLFELKYFFNQALGNNYGGEAHSAEAVRHMIKKLIDEEDPKKILSDDKIVAILKKEGVEIARRTVTKYRESMNIGSSVERRKMKKTLIK